MAMQSAKNATLGGDNLSSQSVESEGEAWESVCTAVNLRWPIISVDELKQCGCDVGELVNHVSQRVDSTRDEVEAIIREYAPQRNSPLHSYIDPIAKRAQEASGRVSDSIHSAMERVRYQVDEAPVTTTMTTFVLGFGLGILAAVIYYRAQPQPTPWEQLRSHRLFGR